MNPSDFHRSTSPIFTPVTILNSPLGSFVPLDLNCRWQNPSNGDYCTVERCLSEDGELSNWCDKHRCSLRNSDPNEEEETRCDTPVSWEGAQYCVYHSCLRLCVVGEEEKHCDQTSRFGNYCKDHIDTRVAFVYGAMITEKTLYCFWTTEITKFGCPHIADNSGLCSKHRCKAKDVETGERCMEVVCWWSPYCKVHCCKHGLQDDLDKDELCRGVNYENGNCEQHGGPSYLEVRKEVIAIRRRQENKRRALEDQRRREEDVEIQKYGTEELDQ